jgi:hypothetical protein
LLCSHSSHHWNGLFSLSKFNSFPLPLSMPHISFLRLIRGLSSRKGRELAAERSCSCLSGVVVRGGGCEAVVASGPGSLTTCRLGFCRERRQQPPSLPVSPLL